MKHKEVSTNIQRRNFLKFYKYKNIYKIYSFIFNHKISNYNTGNRTPHFFYFKLKKIYERERESLKRSLKNFLSYIRFWILKNQREKNLAKILYNVIKKNKKITICDYGSGFNPDIIKLLAKKKIFKKIHCFDFYNDQQLSFLNKNKLNIKFKNIKDLKKVNTKYDVTIVIDVLHHIGVKNKIIKEILINLKKISKILIIKDHYEHSKFDRLLLRIMDFIGNYKDNVNIPKQYFTKESFKETLSSSGFKNVKIISNLKIYSKKFLFFSKSSLHFLCIIK